MFAGIYRDFAGKSKYGDFKFTGIAIPVIFEVNQKEVWTFYIYSLLRFSNFLIIFAGISGVHVIPVIITCTLQGMFCDTGIPRTFYGGKICSVGGCYPIFFQVHALENLRWHPQNQGAD